MSLRTKIILCWVAGILLSLGGAGVVRAVAPHFDGTTRATVSVVGYVMALAGLVVVSYGVRTRVWSQENIAKIEGASPPPESEEK